MGFGGRRGALDTTQAMCCTAQAPNCNAQIAFCTAHIAFCIALCIRLLRVARAPCAAPHAQPNLNGTKDIWFLHDTQLRGRVWEGQGEKDILHVAWTSKGAKVDGTKETQAEMNARSSYVEQLYQRTKAVLKNEFALSTSPLRHHFVSCLVPSSAIKSKKKRWRTCSA